MHTHQPKQQMNCGYPTLKGRPCQVKGNGYCRIHQRQEYGKTLQKVWVRIADMMRQDQGRHAKEYYIDIARESFQSAELDLEFYRRLCHDIRTFPV